MCDRERGPLAAVLPALVAAERMLLGLMFAVVSSTTFAKQPNILDELARVVLPASSSAPATGQIETAFSPKDGAEDLVIKVINSAQKSIRLAAYSFTSPRVMRALIDAKKRGVDVQIIVDDNGNKSKSSVAAMNLVASSDIPLRTLSAYAIHHDKYIVSDRRHLQTGSFNYSQAAAKSNSENVLVIWNNEAVANAYMRQWESRWVQGINYRLNY